MARAAIIGFGGMGQRHFKAYAAAGVEVLAVCDQAPERVLKACPGFPRDRVYAGHRELLKAVKPDILSVASNGPSHAEIAVAAARAGVPRVLVEKPIATSLADARAVIDAFKKSGARLAVNHIRRWSPGYDELKRILSEGVIGRLRHVYFHSGSTGLGNFVLHAFDAMRMLFDDEADWVLGVLDKTGTPNPRGSQFKDPAGYGVIHFRNGGRGFVDSCEDTGVQYQFIFVGEYGRILVDELNGLWTVRARNKAGRALPFTRYGTEMDPVPFDPGVPFDIVDLTRRGILNLLSEAPVLCTGLDGFKALELVIAFHVSSAAGGKRTLLPLKKAAWKKDVPIG